MSVEDFILDFENEQEEILRYFHHYFTSDLNLFPKIRFKIPFYYQKSWICYLNPIKGNGIELAFTRANELSSHPILQTKGRKQIAGIDIFHIKDIPHQEIELILQEAILLDEQVKYSVRKKK